MFDNERFEIVNWAQKAPFEKVVREQNECAKLLCSKVLENYIYIR